MNKILLTKREYLGEGYVFVYTDIKTGNVETRECTKEEYEKGDAPFIENYTYTGGYGGFIKVDTGLLQPGEGVVVNDLVHVCFLKENKMVGEEVLSVKEFDSKYIWQ